MDNFKTYRNLFWIKYGLHNMFKLFLIYPNFQMVSENAQWPPFNFVFFKMLIKHLIRGRIIFRWRVISCSLAIWKQIIVHRMECTNVIYRNIFYCQAFFFFLVYLDRFILKLPGTSFSFTTHVLLHRCSAFCFMASVKSLSTHHHWCKSNHTVLLLQ